MGFINRTILRPFGPEQLDSGLAVIPDPDPGRSDDFFEPSISCIWEHLQDRTSLPCQRSHQNLQPIAVEVYISDSLLTSVDKRMNVD